MGHGPVCPKRIGSTGDRCVAQQVEQGKEPLLKRAHVGQAGGGLILPLALPARVDDERFADSTQFLEQAVDTEGFPVAPDLSL